MSNLKITFSAVDGEAAMLLSMSRLLSMRPWSARERGQLELVETGMLCRLSTDLYGKPCDVELAK